ncbi:filamentous hemagglutinin N-terminal domain-containing protein, partial [Halomonas zhaodongensis]
MNRIYRTVWNAAKGQWQVAPENVKRRGKTVSRRSGTVGTVASLAAGSLLLFPLSAFASGLPSGGDIRAGSGSIEQSGHTMQINQNSDRMAIDWDDFSVEEGHRVDFHQPGRDAAALNRVTGDQLSQIRGAINANGQVFLVNPNGIVFSDTAQVDVGGLVASTLDISPEDFMAGDFTFEGASSSAIINQGNIRASNEGYVALIAAEIINRGNISAPRGDVMMGAGSRVTLDMGGPIKIEVEEALLDTYIEQGGAIQADGGRVYLTAKAAGDLAASVINHTGVTQARTLAENEQGEIWLMGDMDSGETQVAGTLDASAPAAQNPDGGDGGFVETSAAKVSIMDEATVTTRADNGETGEWLIDPQDYTVAPAGGDMTGNALSNNLADNNVTIESVKGGEDGNGDIFVNDEVTWSSGTTLTLNAQRDIEINQEMDASQGDGGKLALEYGQGSTNGKINGDTAIYTVNAPVNLQAGQNFSTQLGSDGDVQEFTVITELGAENNYAGGTLQAIRDNNGNYALGADIDASSTAGWNSDQGWAPIAGFEGIFDGLGHDLSGLTINQPGETRVALFGGLGGASRFLNINLVDVSIDGRSGVGSLIGIARQQFVIRNVDLSGSVTAQSDVGGLVGGMLISGDAPAIIEDSSSSTDVTGLGPGNPISDVGGFVGRVAGGSIIVRRSSSSGTVTGESVGGLIGAGGSGEITDSHVTGKVTGQEFVGGLAGRFSGSINRSYVTGDVEGTRNVGGLVGLNFGEIDSAYATGAVSGNSNSENVGGLVGRNTGSINDAYATGAVTGTERVGGLVGFNDNASIDNAYATGAVNGTKEVGGLVGWSSGGQISNVSASGNVDGDEFVGGLVGGKLNDDITNAYATGAVTGENAVGGLVGGNLGGIINAYATGPVTGENNVGGLLGFSSQGTTENSYAIGQVSGNTNVGGLVGSLGINVTFNNSFYATTDVDGNEINQTNDSGVGEGKNLADMQGDRTFSGWDNSVWAFGSGSNLEGYGVSLPYLRDVTRDSDIPEETTLFADGFGTDTDPYSLTDWHQLQNITHNSDLLSGGKYYVLANDLDTSTEGYTELASASANNGQGWEPINDFSGGLDGLGHNISGLTIDRPSQNFIGLFGGPGASTQFLNINLIDVKINGRELVGSLIGFATAQDLLIRNVHVSGIVTAETDVGGLIGGSFVQGDTANIEDSSSAADVTGPVQAPLSATGGLVGRAESPMNIRRSFATGAVTGDRAGGLIGSMDSGEITDSYAIGNVSGQRVAGGLAGIVRSRVSINRSYATGDVEGIENVGGLVGQNFGEIDSTYATGAVSGSTTSENVGGLVGVIGSGSIKNAYATGAVNGDDNVGGLVGFSSSTSSDKSITNSYATGAVSGNNDIGGLLGNVGNSGSLTVTSSYYAITDDDGNPINDINDSGVGEGETLAALSTAVPFASWDDSVWTIGGAKIEGYGVFRPYLTLTTREEDIPDKTLLFDDGFGTDTAPYSLTDWQQLQNINHNSDVLSGGYHYVLANDLDTSTEGYTALASSTANEGKGWEPIGDLNATFSGTFDGQSNTLSQLNIDRPVQNNVGLFATTNGATIRNVGLKGVSVRGDRNVGGLVGSNEFSSVVNSYSSGSVEGNIRVGGLVGDSSFSSVANSYSSGSVEGNEINAGGLVGFHGNSSEVKNSYATASVIGSKNIGGLAGFNSSSSEVRNSYAIGTVNKGESDADNEGGLIGLNQGDVVASFWDTETTGQSNSAGGTGLSTAEMQNPSTFTDAGWDASIWSFGAGAESAGYGLSRPYLTNVTREEDIPSQTTLFADGFGTEDQPFTLTDWQQLQNINHNDDVLTGGYYYALASNLDTNTDGYAELASENANEGEGWEPIGGNFGGELFTGHFDGNNHTISDLTLERNRWDSGLFGAVTDSSITDLTLHNPSVNALGFSYYAGSLAGRIDNTTVDNVAVNGDLAKVSSYVDVGGLVGSADNSTITNSSSTAAVTGDPSSFNAGGLVGSTLNTTLIENSAASGDISGGAHVGGLIGHHRSGGTLQDVASSGDVTIADTASEATRGYAGGLVGRNEGDIENASASGDVAGLVGNTFNSTDYLGMGSFTGDNEGELRNIQASGSVTASNATGNEIEVADGLLGRNTGALYDGLAVTTNTAHWVQHESAIVLADEPGEPADVDSTTIRNRLDAGINVNLVTTSDYNKTDTDIVSPSTVDLGNTAEHDAVLNLDAASGISLSSQQALRLGEVAATDAIDIATQTGDLTLTGDITTADTSDQALLLSAGTSESAGTSSGGDIVHHQGDLTTGSGGRVLLYTGSLSGSEAIAALIETGDFRYNSTPSETNFTAPLNAERHLIYRKQPEILVSAVGKTVTYGDSIPADYDLKNTRGYVNSDDDSILSGTPQWSVDEALSNAGYQEAGEHRIHYTDGLSNALGYAIVTNEEQTGALTVDPLALTATEIAETESMYGDALVPGDVALKGVLNGDQATAEAAVADVSLSTSNNVNAGTYDQTVDTNSLNGEDAANYALAEFTQPNSAKVTQRALTVTANSATTTYDGTQQDVTGFTAEGLVADETEAALSNVTTSGGRGTDAGSYLHEASGTDNNYALTFKPGELTIDKANATVTANSATTTYDGTKQSITGFTAEGLVAGETEAVLSNVTTSGGSGTDAGSYLHAIDGTAKNYRLAFNDGQLTIDPRPITVTADDQEKIYGDDDPELTWQVTEGNLVGDDSLAGDVTR